MLHRHRSRLALTALLLIVSVTARAETLGLFTDHNDIGEVKHAGTAAFDAATGTYTIGGSGANMWFAKDNFHYIWKKVSGDVALTATFDSITQGTEGHRKGLLMLRQSLDTDSAYIDVARHADGLTSLQFRDAKGAITREIQTSVVGPQRLRLDKIGDTAYLSVGDAGGNLVPTGCSAHIALTGEYYIGLGVCAHNADEFVTVAFSHVEISAPSNAPAAIRSIIEAIPMPSGDRRALYATNDLIEAPNWARDGSALIFNGGGRLHSLALGKLPDGKPILAGDGRPTPIDTGTRMKCNNDHGLSPDGTQLAISDQSKGGKSRIYLLPLTGGTPKEITPNAPSYWHGWSPDGATLAYCAQRNGKFGIFTIPAAGGEEQRLTTTDGLDDGPDYSPDGQWIYFNSDRSGLMQIWRTHPDGSAIQQLTRDDYNNWFAHPSPDGKWIVFLTFARDVKGHPRDKDVMLRVMPAGGGDISVVVKLFGGQGTMNVSSWSPDSSRIAYVRYQPEK